MHTFRYKPSQDVCGGYNWTSRYSWIVESALKNRHKQFVIDGEAVILGADGTADFNALHREGGAASCRCISARPTSSAGPRASSSTRSSAARTHNQPGLSERHPS